MVEHYELIRRKHSIGGLSARTIAQELGHARKTIAKAIKHAIPPGYRRSVPSACPVMDKFGSIVDPWLQQDRQRPRKQRHIARQVFRRLVSEHW